jgi:hypothetical protein
VTAELQAAPVQASSGMGWVGRARLSGAGAGGHKATAAQAGSEQRRRRRAQSSGDAGDLWQSPAPTSPADLRQMAVVGELRPPVELPCTEAGPWRPVVAAAAPRALLRPAGRRRLGNRSWPGAGKARWGRRCWLVAGRRALAGRAGRRRGRPVVGGDQAGRRRSLPHTQDFLFSPFSFYYLGYRGGLYVREK